MSFIKYARMFIHKCRQTEREEVLPVVLSFFLVASGSKAIFKD